MKRYNFDKIPAMASGFGVHATTMKQAWVKAYNLAKHNGYKRKLLFRDNIKCPKYKNSHGYECNICHPL